MHNTVRGRKHVGDVKNEMLARSANYRRVTATIRYLNVAKRDACVAR